MVFAFCSTCKPEGSIVKFFNVFNIVAKSSVSSIDNDLIRPRRKLDISLDCLHAKLYHKSHRSRSMIDRVSMISFTRMSAWENSRKICTIRPLAFSARSSSSCET